ncbi:hypothetical protein [Pseudomonas asiatica]|uniref:hypothetical protein n=1 Tax=Pseudomonas asiatica TaxID=2219225 RepID=UPI003877A1A2
MDNAQKLAILPMWVIDRIKEEMRLSPAAWQVIIAAVEQAEVPQTLPCEVKLPPGTVIGKGVPVSTLMLAIAQRERYPLHAQAFAEQHQGEPVVLPVKMKTIVQSDYANGWNACIALIETLGPLYTHADPSDVRVTRQALESLKGEANDLRVQLAERDAPLREVSGKLIVLAARIIEEPLRALRNDLDSDGSITRIKVADGVDQAGNSLGGLAVAIRRVADALSASAELSAPIELDDLTDLATWKRRAIEAESKLRTYDPQVVELGEQAMQALLAKPNPNELVLTKCRLCDQLQSDLTERDQRIDQCQQVLQKVATLRGTLEQHGLREEVEALLWPGLHSRPEERGTPETEPCSGCGTPGYTGNCDKCIPY